MNIFLIIVLVVALIIVAVIVAAYLQPKAFHFERSVSSTASAPEIYSVFSDLRRWDEWSPWHKFDPHLKTKYDGSPGTVGSAYAWEGNKQVGAGCMTIMDAQPDKRVDLKLEFFRPFKSTSKAAWRVDDAGDHRRITWSMDGENNGLMPRLFSMLMNMDKAIGSSFEEGLASLKKIVER